MGLKFNKDIVEVMERHRKSKKRAAPQQVFLSIKMLMEREIGLTPGTTRTTILQLSVLNLQCHLRAQ